MVNIMEAMSEIPNGIGKPPTVLPTRQLKPGQTATIDPKKYSRDEKGRVYDLLAMAPSVESEVIYLKYQIKNSSDPKIKAELQAKIDRLYDSLGNRKKEFSSIIEKIVPIIKSKCSEFLPTIQKTGFLYRGITVKENKNRLAFRAHSRDYRAPTHSNAAANKLFNDAMEELGLTATRTNSVFATGAFGTAGSFGKVYIFFPCNGSHYTWSETARDLILTPSELYQNAGVPVINYDDLDQYRLRIVNYAEMLYAKAKIDKEPQELINYYMSVYMKLVDMVSHPSRAINVRPMIQYGLRLDGVNRVFLDDIDSLYHDMVEINSRINDVDFDIDLDKFKDFYQLKGDEELNRAILSEHEILFTGEYICVAFGYKDLLLEALGMKKEDLNEDLKPGQQKPLKQFTKLPANLYNNLTTQLLQVRKYIAYLQGQKSRLPGIDGKFLAKHQRTEKTLVTKISKTPAADYSKKDPYAKLIKEIESKCGNYLKAMKQAQMALWRGMSTKDDVIHGRSWVNRETLNSDEEQQETFDKILDKLGILAQRGNSIFTTSAKDQAENYGNLHLIFPLNSSKFAWSKKYKDLVLNYSLYKYFYTDNEKMKKIKNLYDEIVNLLRTDVKSLNKSNLSDKEEDKLMALEGLLDILKTSRSDAFSRHWAGRDVLFLDLEEYSLMPYTKRYTKSIYDLLNVLERFSEKINLDQFQKKYKMSDKDFVSALESEHEIYISGEYIAVKYNGPGKELARRFGFKNL